MYDPVAAFFAQPTPRRVSLIVVFLTLIYVFAGLLPVLAAFAVTVRLLDAGITLFRARTGWSDTRSLLAALAALIVGSAALSAAGWGLLSGLVYEATTYLPEVIDVLEQNELVQKGIESLRGEEGFGLIAAGHAMEALHVVGVGALHLAVGFFLALAYLAERDATDAAVADLGAHSFGGTLLRWVNHVADGFTITVQLQVVVALCNSLITFPVMLVLGIPHPEAVLLLIFLLALIPMIGNLVSGVMLTALAWPAWGWVAPVTFAVLTFLLGKIEGFYLNPRLASRHVRVPGFVLAANLVLFEHLFGFVGFFLSFPFLYVAGRITHELRQPAA